MLTNLLMINFLLVPIAIAGILYPFKPFKTRIRAAKTLGILLLSFIILAFQGPPADKVATVADQTEVDTGTKPSQSATNSAPASTTPTPIAEEEKASDREAARLAQIDEDIRDIYRAFETGNRSVVERIFSKLRRQGVDVEEHAIELENRALASVRPLPASDYDGNIRGYKLLVAIRPENNTYANKVVEYERRRQNARQAVVRRLAAKEDKVEGLTFYTHPNSPRYLNSRSTVYLYVGRKGEGQPWLRMKTIYTASNWLFVERVTAWHDGIKEPFISGVFERDNNAKIWEWRDDIPSGYQIEVLRSLANAKEAILRFEGSQYRKDITLSAGDKKALREVLMAYDVMRLGE